VCSIPFAAWILYIICAEHEEVDVVLLSVLLSLAVGSSMLPE
jgi:hypothetical protein